jgi:hypothetical protein
VLNLCKRFQIENEEFNELLEKDFKTIDEVILASQIVRRSPTAGAKGQDSAGCVGLMLVGLVIAFFAIGPCSSTKPTPSSRDTPPYIAPSPPTYNARPSQNNSESGSSSVYRVPSYVNAELERDKRAIDAEEATAKWLSSQIETLSREIDRERVSFDQTSQYAVDAFNRKVAAYNSLVEKVRVQDRVVNNLIESYNAKLRKYGR